MRHAAQIFDKEKLTPKYLSGVELSKLTDESEVGLIKELASWPRVVEGAAQAHEPHRIAFFLKDLACAFHSLWNKGKDHNELRFIIETDEEITLVRLALIQAVIIVLASGLELIGVEPIQEMIS